MRRGFRPLFFALLSLSLLFITVPLLHAVRLTGRAEDLWGNAVDLSQYAKGAVIIHPFSPSNCGWCLVDGEFVRENYDERTHRAGGTFFGMCLFNPQIDIYTYLKHYRGTFPVLTSPIALHLYHGDGFPFITAFKDGELIHKGWLNPYEKTFKMLASTLWKDEDTTLRPTSPLHMASYFIYENESGYGLLVCADTDEEMLQRMKERFKDSESIDIKYEGELTDEDARKNLVFLGRTEAFRLSSLRGSKIPIAITSESIQIGDYEFPRSEVGLSACFPNPLNKERYIMLKLRGSKIESALSRNWVDYVVSRDRKDGGSEILLYGFFDKSDPNWTFSNHLAYHSKDAEAFCKGGICPAPAEMTESLDLNPRRIPTEMQFSQNPKRLPPVERDGDIWTLGNADCRFPDLIVDRKGISWVAWEEQGDIFLASLNREGDQRVVPVECTEADSFHPILAMGGDTLWILYLSNEDGFYRLYGKPYDGERLSQTVLISEKEPCDAMTPAAAWNDAGKIIITWSDWKANFRFPKYRTLEERFLGEIQSIQIKLPENKYVNAWCASLVLGADGGVWGAWNQHYPLMLGVYAGDLTSEAKTVSEDNGGYPSIIIDRQGTPWVFWESFMWEALKGKPQVIHASYYDRERQQWALPYTLSSNDQTIFNQTPKAAVSRDGTIWVVWSGKSGHTDPWGVYLSRLERKTWTPPVALSRDGEYARAPAIAPGSDGNVWVTWHSGRGSEMRVKVVRMDGGR